MKQNMNLINRLSLFAFFSIILIFTQGSIAERTGSNYQDFEKKCENGQRVSGIKSSINNEGLRTFTVTCADLPNRGQVQVCQKTV